MSLFKSVYDDDKSTVIDEGMKHLLISHQLCFQRGARDCPAGDRGSSQPS